MYPDLPKQERKESLEKVLKLMEKGKNMILFPEVLTVLKTLKKSNLTLNILSGNNQNFIKSFLKENNILPFFNSILTPDFLKTEKSNIFNYYINTQFEQTKILHVGDDPELDYHWPESLGLNTIWLKRENSRYSDESIPKNKTINSLSELSQLL